MLARFCSMRAVTCGGLQARATSLLLWDSEIRSLADAPDNAHFPFTERMLAALLRDMMVHRSTGQGLGKIETELAQSASRFPA
jgi:hypothetical protein